MLATIFIGKGTGDVINPPVIVGVEAKGAEGVHDPDQSGTTIRRPQSKSAMSKSRSRVMADFQRWSR